MSKHIKILIILALYILYILLNSIFPNVIWFSFFSLLVFLISKPIFLLSPKSIIFAYYFLWFGLAPIFAERYNNINHIDHVFFMAYLFLSTSYVTLIIVCEMFVDEFKYLNLKIKKIHGASLKLIYIFSLFTFLFLFLYIQTTGGISYWLQNLDRAFLTRQGAGAYYLGFSLLLPVVLFLFGIKFKSIWPILILAAIVLALSPFIGSKQKIIIMFLTLFIPKIYLNKLNIKNMTLFLVPVILLFILGNYFRNSSWMGFSDILAYSLNYFDTLDSLFIVLKDYNSFDVMTFLLPFNKIYNLLNGSDEFFDLSAYLTAIYFSHAWDIRATVQFPIEVDLYLSFGYWFGLPFLFIFCMSYCLVYKKSLSSKKPIMIYIWFYLFIYFISHLRGGVFLWTDMYVYPYLIALYFIFRNRLRYV